MGPAFRAILRLRVINAQLAAIGAVSGDIPHDQKMPGNALNITRLPDTDIKTQIVIASEVPSEIAFLTGQSEAILNRVILNERSE